MTLFGEGERRATRESRRREWNSGAQKVSLRRMVSYFFVGDYLLRGEIGSRMEERGGRDRGKGDAYAWREVRSPPQVCPTTCTLESAEESVTHAFTFFLTSERSWASS